MNPTPSITVAIPTYNGAGHLREALAGVLAQHPTPFELLVSDDRSEDETLEVVRESVGSRARVVVNSERLGLAGNWNQCVRMCRTPFAAILHQDDVWRPGHLRAHLEAFASGAEIGLVASGSTVIDEQGRPVPPGLVDPGGMGPSDRDFAPGEAVVAMAAGNPLRCSAVSIRASAHARVGGFDPGYRYVVDWDFWLRIARRFGVAWLGAPSVAVRWHLASETHRFAKGTTDLEETERVLAELRNEVGANLGNALRTGRQRLARAYLNRAYVALRAGDGDLSRRCLLDALKRSPRLLGGIALDPRLAIRMGSVALAPGLAGRWFQPREGER